MARSHSPYALIAAIVATHLLVSHAHAGRNFFGPPPRPVVPPSAPPAPPVVLPSYTPPPVVRPSYTPPSYSPPPPVVRPSYAPPSYSPPPPPPPPPPPVVRPTYSPPPPPPPPVVRPSYSPPPPPPPTPAATPAPKPDLTWASNAYNALRNLQQRTGAFSDVKLQPKTGRVKLISGGRYTPAGNDAEEKARNFLRENGAVFGVPPSLTGLQVISKRRSIIGQHVVFAQTYNGIRVADATLSVHFDPQGRVFQASSSFKPNLAPKQGRSITKQQALDRVNVYLKRRARPGDRPNATYVIYDDGSQQTPAWEVWFTPHDRRGAWRIVVDALTGAILSAQNRLQRLNNVPGTVFDPNPIKALDNSTARPFSDAASPLTYSSFDDQSDANYLTGNLAQAYFSVILTDLFDNGVDVRLEGPTVRITPTVTRPVGSASFADVRRDNPEFEAVNAYHWINSIARYIETIISPGSGLLSGPPPVRDRNMPDTIVQQIDVQVHDVATQTNDPFGSCCVNPGDPACAFVNVGECDQNLAFYDPAEPSLHFGNGGTTDLNGVEQQNGIDLAEDADAILHEYAHALQDGAIQNAPRCCVGAESLGMGEGFGDYQAAMFAEIRGRAGRDPATVAAWVNSTPIGTGGPLRRLDGDRNVGADTGCAGCDDEHLLGQIWSAALWDIKRTVGFQIANRAIYASNALRAGDDTFDIAATHILTAHSIADGGTDTERIRACFVARGILPPPPADTAGPLVNNSAAVTKTVNKRLLQVGFTEPLNQVSVTQERFHNSTAGGVTFAGQARNFVVVGHTVASVGQTQAGVVSIALSDEMATDETPEVRILEVTDVAGNRSSNLSFGPPEPISVVPADGIPPRVVSVVKSGTNDLIVTFSELVQVAGPTPIGSSTFSVSGGRTITSVSPATGNTTQVTLTLSRSFNSVERFIVRVTGPISDVAGNRLNGGGAPFVTP